MFKEYVKTAGFFFAIHQFLWLKFSQSVAGNLGLWLFAAKLGRLSNYTNYAFIKKK